MFSIKVAEHRRQTDTSSRLTINKCCLELAGASQQANVAKIPVSVDTVSTTCAERAEDHFGLVWFKFVHFSRSYAIKRFVHFLFPVTLTFDLLTSNLTSQWPVCLDQKFAVSTALRLWVNQKHETDRRKDRRTDGVQHLIRPACEGRVICEAMTAASGR